MKKGFKIILGQSGYTVIELCLIISLLSIMAFTAIPNDNASLVPLSLDAASRKLKSDIRYAQDIATTTGESYGFRTTGASSYEIYNVSTNELALSPLSNQELSVDLNDTYSGVAFENNYTVEFDEWGKAIVGAGQNIELSDSAHTKSITITSETGYVYLSE